MSNTVIVHAPEYANWVFDNTHPTQGRRFTAGHNMIQAIANVRTIEPTQIDRGLLNLAHDPAYISRVLNSHVSEEWAGPRPDLAALARLFAGGTMTALNELVNGTADLAIHLPGAKHHAMWDHASGFCVFADFAIAAKVAVAHGMRVAILDVDAHHGDGTEALTSWDPYILTFSIHEDGIFPGTGQTSDPENFVFNFPLGGEWGYRRMDNAGLFMGVEAFVRRAKDFQPDILFIAGGADGHVRDPLSNLLYTRIGYVKALRLVRDAFPSLPVLFGGAGGYLPDDVTPQVWTTMVETLNQGS